MGGTVGGLEASVHPAARPAIVLVMEIAHGPGADVSVVIRRATTTETSLLTAITERWRKYWFRELFDCIAGSG